MKKEVNNLSEISNKILDLLLEEGIETEKISMELFKIQEDIENTLWEKVTMSFEIFNKLKDTIYINFEHYMNTDKITGRTDLRYYATKYPAFLLGTSEEYVNNKYVSLIIKELEDVMSNWNDQIYTAQLYSKQDFNWIIGDENPSSMIIYNKDTESPGKYGYYNNSPGKYGQIYGVDGNVLRSDKNNNIILCSINKVDVYREYGLLTRTLEKLLFTFKKAESNNKGIHFDFNNYDYK